jgi:hypothetical protein
MVTLLDARIDSIGPSYESLKAYGGEGHGGTLQIPYITTPSDQAQRTVNLLKLAVFKG